LFAFVDVLAKTFLTCVPEPPREVQDQAVALGKIRYDRFLKSKLPARRGHTGEELLIARRQFPTFFNSLPILYYQQLPREFLRSVGMAMVGDSQAAMAELLGRGHEN